MRFAWKKAGKLEVVPTIGANNAFGLLDEIVASLMAVLEYVAMIEAARQRRQSSTHYMAPGC